jgi:hypothetical protein
MRLESALTRRQPRIIVTEATDLPHAESIATRSALICVFTALAPSLRASHRVGAHVITHHKKPPPCQLYDTLTAKYQRPVILLTREPHTVSMDTADFGVHFSTDLHDPNQWTATAVDEDDSARKAEYSAMRSDSALLGFSREIRVIVTSRHKFWHAVCCFWGPWRTYSLTSMNPLDRRPFPWLDPVS